MKLKTWVQYIGLNSKDPEFSFMIAYSFVFIYLHLCLLFFKKLAMLIKCLCKGQWDMRVYRLVSCVGVIQLFPIIFYTKFERYASMNTFPEFRLMFIKVAIELLVQH